MTLQSKEDEAAFADFEKDLLEAPEQDEIPPALPAERPSNLTDTQDKILRAEVMAETFRRQNIFVKESFKPVVVPLWPFGDLQMNGDEPPRIPEEEAKGILQTSSESEKFVQKFLFIWLIAIGACVIASIPAAFSSNAFLFIQGFLSLALIIAMKVCRTGRGVSFLMLDKYDLVFVWMIGGGVEKREKYDYHLLQRIMLEKKGGFSKPAILFEFTVGVQQRLPLESFPSKERWRYFVAECLKKSPRAYIDPDIEEALMPDPKDSSYTELWLEALGAPPKRERLLPLEPDMAMKSGKYKIVRQIGVGGQGTAYLATTSGDEGEPDREVVLKEYMLPVYVDIKARKKALENFEKEARMLSRLKSESIVGLLDFFAEDHRAYLVLEYIPGDSLRTLIEKQGALSEKEAVALGLDMCEVLVYLQEQEPPVVHRDFTPDNLMRRSDGKVKLIDFMVAQECDTTSMTSSVVGKQSYMPPEQFRGQTTIQSDIYACGGILYYLVTGNDPEALSQSHPLLANQDLSPEFNEIVERATNMDEYQRFKSAKEMQQALLKLRDADHSNSADSADSV